MRHATQERWKQIHGPVQGLLFLRDEEAQSSSLVGTCEGKRSHRRPAPESIELPEGLEGQEPSHGSLYKVGRQYGNREEGSVGMPSVRTLTVSKGALKKLSNSAIDFDVRPHELVDAIVLNTNWETQVEKLVKIIRDGRRVDTESSPSPPPSLSPSLTKDRAPSESSPSPRRVDTESPPSPKDSTKTTKKTREDSVRVAPEPAESPEARKT